MSGRVQTPRGYPPALQYTDCIAQVRYLELTVVVQVQDHGVPALRDTAYLRVIVHSSTSSWQAGQTGRVPPRSPPLPPGRRAVAAVAVAVACCAVILAALALLLVVVVRRRTSDCKETTTADYYQTYQCYVETVTDNG